MLPLILLELIMLYIRTSHQLTKNFVNTSMPEMRPTFVVNFDMATVICQHSPDSKDLHLHQMSILCDGKPDCFGNPAMHDEIFPYCDGKCSSTCNNRGACLFDGESAQCYCNAGYHGPTCELLDNNECEERPCHWLAHCQNTYGSYHCQCFPGFHGNGHSCSDIDECRNGAAKCPEYSQCVNLPGTYFCNCTEGFMPRGLPLERCADIDECEQGLHNCPATHKCENKLGSYSCVEKCDYGYATINGSCVDIDECATKRHNCDKRAECRNTPGSFECKCEKGFSGDGIACYPVRDCTQQEGICDRHGFCIGSLKMCLCQAGYTGDGYACRDVNECTTKGNPCDAKKRCVNIEGGYICCDNGTDDQKCIKDQGVFCAGGCGLHAMCVNETCQCIPGFAGDPKTRCNDINECELDGQCAGVGQWCVNMMGGFVCCGAESTDAECRGLVIQRTPDGRVILAENATTEQIMRGERGPFIAKSAAKSVKADKSLDDGKKRDQTVIIIGSGAEPSCKDPCAANAECFNGSCRCLEGFEGNAYLYCQDIDECTISPATTCSHAPGTWCLNTIGGYRCCHMHQMSSECIGLELTGESSNKTFMPEQTARISIDSQHITMVHMKDNESNRETTKDTLIATSTSPTTKMHILETSTSSSIRKHPQSISSDGSTLSTTTRLPSYVVHSNIVKTKKIDDEVAITQYSKQGQGSIKNDSGGFLVVFDGLGGNHRGGGLELSNITSIKSEVIPEIRIPYRKETAQPPTKFPFEEAKLTVKVVDTESLGNSSKPSQITIDESSEEDDSNDTYTIRQHTYGAFRNRTEGFVSVFDGVRWKNLTLDQVNGTLASGILIGRNVQIVPQLPLTVKITVPETRKPNLDPKSNFTATDSIPFIGHRQPLQPKEDEVQIFTDSASKGGNGTILFPRPVHPQKVDATEYQHIPIERSEFSSLTTHGGSTIQAATTLQPFETTRFVINTTAEDNAIKSQPSFVSRSEFSSLTTLVDETIRDTTTKPQSKTTPVFSFTVAESIVTKQTKDGPEERFKVRPGKYHADENDVLRLGAVTVNQLKKETTPATTMRSITTESTAFTATSTSTETVHSTQTKGSLQEHLKIRLAKGRVFEDDLVETTTKEAKLIRPTDKKQTTELTDTTRPADVTQERAKHPEEGNKVRPGKEGVYEDVLQTTATGDLRHKLTTETPFRDTSTINPEETGLVITADGDIDTNRFGLEIGVGGFQELWPKNSTASASSTTFATTTSAPITTPTTTTTLTSATTTKQIVTSTPQKPSTHATTTQRDTSDEDLPVHKTNEEETVTPQLATLPTAEKQVQNTTEESPIMSTHKSNDTVVFMTSLASVSVSSPSSTKTTTESTKSTTASAPLTSTSAITTEEQAKRTNVPTTAEITTKTTTATVPSTTEGSTERVSTSAASTVFLTKAISNTTSTTTPIATTTTTTPITTTTTTIPTTTTTELPTSVVVSSSTTPEPTTINNTRLPDSSITTSSPILIKTTTAAHIITVAQSATTEAPQSIRSTTSNFTSSSSQKTSTTQLFTTSSPSTTNPLLSTTAPQKEKAETSFNSSAYTTPLISNTHVGSSPASTVSSKSSSNVASSTTASSTTEKATSTSSTSPSTTTSFTVNTSSTASSISHSIGSTTTVQPSTSLNTSPMTFNTVLAESSPISTERIRITEPSPSPTIITQTTDLPAVPTITKTSAVSLKTDKSNTTSLHSTISLIKSTDETTPIPVTTTALDQTIDGLEIVWVGEETSTLPATSRKSQSLMTRTAEELIAHSSSPVFVTKSSDSFASTDLTAETTTRHYTLSTSPAAALLTEKTTTTTVPRTSTLPVLFSTNGTVATNLPATTSTTQSSTTIGASSTPQTTTANEVTFSTRSATKVTAVPSTTTTIASSTAPTSKTTQSVTKTEPPREATTTVKPTTLNTTSASSPTTTISTSSPTTSASTAQTTTEKISPTMSTLVSTLPSTISLTNVTAEISSPETFATIKIVKPSTVALPTITTTLKPIEFRISDSPTSQPTTTPFVSSTTPHEYGIEIAEIITRRPNATSISHVETTSSSATTVDKTSHTNKNVPTKGIANLSKAPEVVTSTGFTTRLVFKLSSKTSEIKKPVSIPTDHFVSLPHSLSPEVSPKTTTTIVTAAPKEELLSTTGSSLKTSASTEPSKPAFATSSLAPSSIVSPNATQLPHTTRSPEQISSTQANTEGSTQTTSKPSVRSSSVSVPLSSSHATSETSLPATALTTIASTTTTTRETLTTTSIDHTATSATISLATSTSTGISSTTPSTQPELNSTASTYLVRAEAGQTTPLITTTNTPQTVKQTLTTNATSETTSKTTTSSVGLSSSSHTSLPSTTSTTEISTTPSEKSSTPSAVVSSSQTTPFTKKATSGTQLPSASTARKIPLEIFTEKSSPWTVWPSNTTDPVDKLLTSTVFPIQKTTLQETVAPLTATIGVIDPYWTTKDTFSLTTSTAPAEPNVTRGTRCISSDDCGRDALCERRAGVCRCKPGFEGRPPHIQCTDVNECEKNLHDCHQTARCHNYIGGYVCVCAVGYRRATNGICADIDECQERSSNQCHSNAFCANLPGSYSCQCNPGFFGDGYTCVPLEKRHCTQHEWEKSDCGRNHLCLVDAYGTRDCDLCKNGFMKAHGICSDINECENLLTNTCHPDAVCSNLVGTFTCNCQSGYRGDGFSCQDIDECQWNPCHPQAECLNVPGSFTCTCPAGWMGDGKITCLNPRDSSCMLKEAACGGRIENTACLSVDVGAGLQNVCECDPGYRFIPETKECVDVDECLENRHHCDPATAQCFNEPGSYHCQCAPGYEGNGGICADVDECERGISGCHFAAKCVNYAGSVGCRCSAGYTGDGIDCTPLNPDSMRKAADDDCDAVWIRQCRKENKTCHVDEESNQQCGACIFGHQPIDGRCQEVNLLGNCADPLKNNCDDNADCIDVHPGRHICTCKLGYIGDGLRCDDVDECTIPRICDTEADCQNTNGSYDCICKSGFTGNGKKCIVSTNSVGGPNCHLDTAMCHKEARCLLSGRCECNAGFTGDGVKRCELTTAKDKAAALLKTNEVKLNGTGLFAKPPAISPSHASAGNHSVNRTVQPVEINNQMPIEAIDIDMLEAQKTTPTVNKVQVNLRADGLHKPGDEEMRHMFGKQTTSVIAIDDSSTPQPRTTTAEVLHTSFPTLIDGSCSAMDRTQCHVLAVCDLKAGKCKCRPGFEGDGFTGCHRSWEDCVFNSTICDTDATCSPTTRRCQCDVGFVGDGITCVLDRMDCINRKNICSDFAKCENRRCQCGAGYTGDGITCMHLASTGCENCHKEADCIERECKCRRGFFGNGENCVPDPNDCIHYPGLCHEDATCDPILRSCRCNGGFIGDGIHCKVQQSCIGRPDACHQFAVCLSGICQCIKGYAGNGIDCRADFLHVTDSVTDPSTTVGVHFDEERCKETCSLDATCHRGQCVCNPGFEGNGTSCNDINECLVQSTCHHLATCSNVPGDAICICPRGYRGDGRRTCDPVPQRQKIGSFGVDCEADGMTLVLANDTELFDGRIFVRGQTENPHCSKKFSPLKQSGEEYRFKVPFAHCTVRLDSEDTYAVTVVVQKHPMFITSEADAYDLRCTYPAGRHTVSTQFNVSDITTYKTIQNDGSGPRCQLLVTNEQEKTVSSASVGEVLRLILSVKPNDTYSILPRNCYALNMETGERYGLTDRAGCAIEPHLFPEWTRETPSVTQATFRTFKWPDSSMIRFQCDCSACIGSCPQVNCGRRRMAMMRRRFRYRYVREADDHSQQHVDDPASAIISEVDYADRTTLDPERPRFADFDDTDLAEIDANVLQTSIRPFAFSSVILVGDDAEERKAQHDMDVWLGNKPEATHSTQPPQKMHIEEVDDRLCVRPMWLTASLLGLLLGCTMLATVAFIYRRHKGYRAKTQAIRAFDVVSLHTDSASAYLGF